MITQRIAKPGIDDVEVTITGPANAKVTVKMAHDPVRRVYRTIFFDTEFASTIQGTDLYPASVESFPDC